MPLNKKPIDSIKLKFQLLVFSLSLLCFLLFACKADIVREISGLKVINYAPATIGFPLENGDAIILGWKKGIVAERFDFKTGKASVVHGFPKLPLGSEVLEVDRNKFIIVGGEIFQDKWTATNEVLLLNLSDSSVKHMQSLLTPRYGHYCFYMADNKVLVVGGFDTTKKEVLTVEILDLERSTAIVAARLKQPYRDFLLLKNNLLLMKGVYKAPDYQYSPEAGILDIKTGQFREIPPLNRGIMIEYSEGKVFIAGDGSESQIYDIYKNTVESVPDTPDYIHNPEAMYKLRDGRIVIKGNADAYTGLKHGVVELIYIFDPGSRRYKLSRTINPNSGGDSKSLLLKSNRLFIYRGASTSKAWIVDIESLP